MTSVRERVGLTAVGLIAVAVSESHAAAVIGTAAVAAARRLDVLRRARGSAGSAVVEGRERGLAATGAHAIGIDRFVRLVDD
jgi:hypothetical protein